MSSIVLKHMSVITDGKFAAYKSEAATYSTIITAGGYNPEEMLGTLYLCWFKEFEEMCKFPEEYRKVAATILVDLSETLIEFRGEVNNIEELYVSSIQAGFDDNLYPIEVKTLLEEKTETHCRILKNSIGRIINSK